mgnify:CR=1 FL=1
MTALSLNQRIDLWEKGLDRLAQMIDQKGAEGENLLPLFQRIERELAADTAKRDALGAVSQRLARLKGEKATQSLQAHRA